MKKKETIRAWAIVYKTKGVENDTIFFHSEKDINVMCICRTAERARHMLRKVFVPRNNKNHALKIIPIDLIY